MNAHRSGVGFRRWKYDVFIHPNPAIGEQNLAGPGGKGQFGDEVLDVVTQGELIEKGTRIRVISHSGRESVVEPAA